MKKPTQAGILALAFAGLTLVSATPAALAGDSHHYRGHGHYKHYAPKHGYHYRRYDSDDDEKLIYGLLVGGLFGYVIGNAQQQPAPVYAPPETSYPRYSAPATTCLQEREYQMKVIVGGKEADAYGTACLQPDGSWFRGPARVVSR